MIWKISGLITVMVMSSFFISAQVTADQRASLETEADTLLARQQYTEALALYSKILGKAKPKTEEDYSTLYKRAFCYFGMAELEHALADVNACIAYSPNPQARLLRLSIYEQQGNQEAQLNDLNEIIASNPDPYMLRWRTSVLLSLGKNKEAQHDIRTLLAYGADPELQLYLGLTYYYLNNTDSAFIEFDKVIAADPAFIQTYIYAGSLCLEEGYYDQALVYLNQGLKQEPGNTTLLYYKGVVLIEKKDVDEGCRCLSKAFYSGYDDAGEYLKEFCFGEQ